MVDSLERGQNYDDLGNCIHIGILDFALDGLTPEFYAEYKIKNIRNGEVFSDKLRLNVLTLKHLDIATEEDCEYGLVMWARYFNASTWEELKMLVQDFPVMEKPVSEAKRLSEEQIIREQMILREEGIRVRRTELSILKKAQERAKKAEAELGEEKARAEKAEAELGEEKARAEKAEAELGEEKARAEKAESELGEEKARAKKAEAELGEEKARAERAEAELERLKKLIAGR